MTTHVVRTQFPIEAGLNEKNFRLNTDKTSFTDLLTDEANFPGGDSPAVFELSGEASAADISRIIQQAAADKRAILAIGAQSSLTGAAVPRGETLINFSRQTRTEHLDTSDGRHLVKVQPGVTFTQLEQELASKNLFVAGAPTWTDATVGGATSTNAGGAKSYKYGAMRNAVQGLKVVLANGELLEMERGQYIAHEGDAEAPGGYFIIEGETGDSYRLPIPNITMPNVPKISAGYYARPQMDLVDLFVGSEGTLGIIAAATIEVHKEPPTYMALIPCENDDQALDLIAALSSSESVLEPERVSAVEYMGAKVVELVKSQKSVLPDGAAFILAQVEGDQETALEPLGMTCEGLGIDSDQIMIADSRLEKKKLADIRESAPETVNQQIARNKAKDTEATGKDSEVTKVGADPCVNPKHLHRMIDIYLEEAAGKLDIYFWGHGEGNLHFNTLPRDAKETALAKKIVFRGTARVIKELGGTGTAEHGVGKNPTKQELLKLLYGENGVASMKSTKKALDPQNILAPGNIFST